MNSKRGSVVGNLPGRATLAAVLALLSVLCLAPSASGAAQPLAGGEASLALSSGFVGGLRRAGVTMKALKPAKLAGRKLVASVASGSFDSDAGRGMFELAGGLELRSGRRSVALRAVRLDAGTNRLTGTIAGRRVYLGRLAGAKLTKEGFDAHLKVSRLPLTAAGAATLNRALALPQLLRPGLSLGSVNGRGEPASLPIAFGTIAIGGPETTFSKLASMNVQMGLWGSSERWGEVSPPTFLFPVEPTAVSPDAREGVLAGGADDGITFQIESPPPRNMLLRGPRIDLATGELSATVSALSTEEAVTATIATLDYSGATFQVRPKVGTVELMGIRAVATQLIAEQLDSRFATSAFQAGETFARVTVTLHA